MRCWYGTSEIYNLGSTKRERGRGERGREGENGREGARKRQKSITEE
jgi:hypothetical protein